MPEEWQGPLVRALHKLDLDDAEALSRAGYWVCGGAWGLLRVIKRQGEGNQYWRASKSRFKK
jgi:hypothetical protein